MTEVQTECTHQRVNYSNPLTCADCGVTLGEDDGKIKSVVMADLSPDKQAAILKASEKLSPIFARRTGKKGALGTTVEVEGMPWPPRGKEQIAALNAAIPEDEPITVELPEVEIIERSITTPRQAMGDHAKAEKPAKPAKGAITSIEVATAKERVFTVNGIKFYAAVTGQGHRILSACDQSKKTLESAGRVLIIKGFKVDVKRSKEDKKLWLLSAREKKPSGPWPDGDEKTNG